MRLAYVSADPGIPVSGTKGASIHLRAIARALVRRGHDLTVLAARGAGQGPPDLAPRLVEIGYDRVLKDLKRRVSETSGRRSLPREIYSMALNMRVGEALEALDREATVDAVYERYSLWSWAAARFCRQRRIPFVLESNAPLVEEERIYRHIDLDDVAEAVAGTVFSSASAVVVPSRELVASAVAAGAASKRIHVLPNGVEPELFTDPPPLPEELLRPLDGRFVLAFVGSLKPWHGVDSLLATLGRLFDRVPDLHLLVLGDGPLRAKVVEARQRYGGERISYPGAVPHEEVASWLSHAHLGLAPYPELEGFYFSPLKVVEYQAAGLAVVASRIGHLETQIEDGRTGLLVPPGDQEALARAVLRLHEDRALCRRLGRRARRQALHRSSWDQVASRIETLLSGDRRQPGNGSSEALVAAVAGGAP